MQQKYAGRVALILFILFLALWAIFPSLLGAPHRLFDPDIPFHEKHALKPGIDMVGGVSLLYEIRVPEEVIMPGENLAEEMMYALRRRVDPDGVRNLIWRPQGNTRLEIQMPLTGRTEEAIPRRDDYVAAQRELERTNVRPAEVRRIVETLEGDERRDELNRLAMDSRQRGEIFGALASVYDQIQQARQEQDAQRQAALELQYDRLLGQIPETNLSVTLLEETMELSEELRDERLAQLREQFADFPSRLAAIDQFEQAFHAFAPVRGAVDAAADLKRLLQGSGVLQYHIVVADWEASDVRNETRRLVQRLHERGPRVEAGDRMRWMEVERPEEFIRQGQMTLPMEEYNERYWMLVWITPDKSMVNRPGEPRWALQRAYRTTDDQNRYVVGFTFDPTGARLFSQLTGANVGEPLAVVLDETIISAPNIRTQIGQRGIIQGGRAGYTHDELSYLISTLNAGSLPAQLADEPISERHIGPQLGQDNLRRGLIACLAGLVIVAVFLISYYYIAGMVAMVAVLMNMVLILGVMAALDATFTLAGVAAIVLTIGMSVDANVLIFERLREEQNRGLSLKMAVKNGYDKAFSAILDANVTTGITALILYVFGSEEVKGFGITLLIGLISSFFTALFVTRTIFGILMDKFALKNINSLPLTFPAWDRLLTPNIDWMRKVKYFAVGSVAIMIFGLAAFGVKFAEGELLDVEFTSGTQVQFDLAEGQEMPIDQMRDLFTERSDPEVLPRPVRIVSVGTGDSSYEVITTNISSEQVQREVQRVLGDRLDVEEPSEFDHAGVDLAEAMQLGVVVPIERATQSVAGFVPSNLPAHVGGVAIVLENLSPQLSPSEVENRIERQRFQPQTDEAMARYRDVSVEAPDTGAEAPANLVVVLVSDPDLPYERDPVHWQDHLANPMWLLVNEAVTRPAELQRVSNFDAQVAGEAQRAAMTALTLAIIVIMVYIWLRFGNLKFGTATVVALVHDTLFVVAAIGFAHYLADTLMGRALMIDAFRIDLTIIAAVLTVIGYSINDTIVIFDRIRENRGKYGMLSRDVINTSINQTLSRTILTSGTTLAVLLVMYIFGGAGIHGFTYVLLIGILVGTYSSIAIASPILMLGMGGGRRAEKPIPAEPAQKVGA